jgi:protein-S-isoprenylcysteine O-methyltransferase Ste14
MTSRMTVFGAAHKIALITLPVLALTLFLGMQYRGPFRYGVVPEPVLIRCGIGLMAAGLSITFASAIPMTRAFAQKRLLTARSYGIIRNPMYASFIFFTLPDLSLALNCRAVLTTSVALYLATAIFVKYEEVWLVRQFGDVWEAYTNRVGRIIPKV